MKQNFTVITWGVTTGFKLILDKIRRISEKIGPNVRLKYSVLQKIYFSYMMNISVTQKKSLNGVEAKNMRPDDKVGVRKNHEKTSVQVAKKNLRDRQH